jgi:hypothetical protein
LFLFGLQQTQNDGNPELLEIDVGLFACLLHHAVYLSKEKEREDPPPPHKNVCASVAGKAPAAADLY